MAGKTPRENQKRKIKKNKECAMRAGFSFKH